MDEVKILIELVRTRSLSGEEKEIAGVIREKMEDVGVDSVRVDRLGNVIAEVKGGGRRKIMFEGHMDHVPEGNIENWRVHPYSGEIIDGRLYGRGSVDMKASIAAMISAAGRMRELEDDIYFAFVVHEEDQEGFGIRYVIEKEGIKPDVVILGEPTNLNVAIGHRGRAEILLKAAGLSCHSSMPEEGENALFNIIDAISRIRQVDLRYHPLLGRGTIAPVNINCKPGIIPVIPEKCTALLDLRFVPGENIEEILRRISSDKVSAQIAKRRIKCYTGYEEEVLALFPSWIYEGVLSDRAVRVLPQAKKIVWRFGTDGSYTAGIAGIPTIGYGPGDDRLAHKPNENVSVDDVRRAVNGYLSLAENIFNEETTERTA
jgi:putative selenium metabolism hydrolase